MAPVRLLDGMQHAQYGKEAAEQDGVLIASSH
jgi:hypothetical protein